MKKGGFNYDTIDERKKHIPTLITILNRLILTKGIGEFIINQNTFGQINGEKFIIDGIKKVPVSDNDFFYIMPFLQLINRSGITFNDVLNIAQTMNNEEPTEIGDLFATVFEFYNLDTKNIIENLKLVISICKGSINETTQISTLIQISAYLKYAALILNILDEYQNTFARSKTTIIGGENFDNDDEWVVEKPKMQEKLIFTDENNMYTDEQLANINRFINENIEKYNTAQFIGNNTFSIWLTNITFIKFLKKPYLLDKIKNEMFKSDTFEFKKLDTVTLYNILETYIDSIIASDLWEAKTNVATDLQELINVYIKKRLDDTITTMAKIRSTQKQQIASLETQMSSEINLENLKTALFNNASDDALADLFVNTVSDVFSKEDFEKLTVEARISIEKDMQISIGTKIKSLIFKGNKNEQNLINKINENIHFAEIEFKESKEIEKYKQDTNSILIFTIGSITSVLFTNGIPVIINDLLSTQFMPFMKDPLSWGSGISTDAEQNMLAFTSVITIWAISNLSLITNFSEKRSITIPKLGTFGISDGLNIFILITLFSIGISSAKFNLQNSHFLIKIFLNCILYSGNFTKKLLIGKKIPLIPTIETVPDVPELSKNYDAASSQIWASIVKKSYNYMIPSEKTVPTIYTGEKTLIYLLVFGIFLSIISSFMQTTFVKRKKEEMFLKTKNILEDKFSFRLDEFEKFQQSIDETLGSELDKQKGVLSNNLRQSLEAANNLKKSSLLEQLELRGMATSAVQNVLSIQQMQQRNPELLESLKFDLRGGINNIKKSKTARKQNKKNLPKNKGGKNRKTNKIKHKRILKQ
jgi:hypothetical protein